MDLGSRGDAPNSTMNPTPKLIITSTVDRKAYIKALVLMIRAGERLAQSTDE
jgi:hypothetical protein